MSKISLTSKVVRSSDQVSTDLGGEAVILGLQSGEYFELKAVGARIWDEIREPKTAGEIVDVLVNDYAVERHQCERDLLALLESLAAERLIEATDEPAR
jgi:hypothetical protein